MKRVVDDVNKTVEFYAYSYEHVKIQSTLLNFPWSQLETSHGWRLYEHVNKKRFFAKTYRINLEYSKNRNSN